jgi:hypothetical protein
MPLLSEYQCCVSAWATFIVGFRASPVSIGTTFTCRRCTRVWERVQQVEGSRGRDRRWMLIDEPEPEPELTDAQERLARQLLEMYANREENRALIEQRLRRLDGGEP